MFSKSVKILTLQGFDIKVDASWLLIATLVTWSLATQYFPSVLPDISPTSHFWLALFTMLGFFASLVLHELAHSVVARQYGVKINGITLFVFGGVAELDSEPETARSEFWIAIAGPIMSFALALGFWFVGTLLSSYGSTLLTQAAGYLSLVNLVLAVFNLVPAFPLDGGRIFRAYLWARTGDLTKATNTAARAGTMFAYVLILLGLFIVFSGSTIAGLWQIFIGIFLLTAARSASQNQFMKVAFLNKNVGNLMTTKSVVCSPDRSLAELVNQVFLRHKISFAPVVENGVLLGYVDADVLTKIDRENWPNTRVQDVFVALADVNSVEVDLPIEDLMKLILKTGRRKFLVAHDRQLLGVITLSDMMEYLAILQEINTNANGHKQKAVLP